MQRNGRKRGGNMPSLSRHVQEAGFFGEEIASRVSLVQLLKRLHVATFP
jgi:hypothetical protein